MLNGGGTLGSGAISLTSGGTLTGALTTTGSVTSNGGVIAPNAGTLTVGGLSLNSTTSLDYTLGSASGLINDSGSAALGGAIVNVTAGPNFGDAYQTSYTLLDYASHSGQLTLGTLPLNGTFFTYGSLTYGTNSVSLSVTRLANTFLWTGAGTDTNWTDTANWNTNSGLYPVSVDTATLNVAGSQSITVDSAATVATMNVMAGSWIIGGQGITIGSGGLNYQSTGTSVIRAPITGSTLNVSAGNLKLQNAQTFSGKVTVGASSGTATLLVDASAALYASSVVINAGGVLSGNGTIDVPVNLAGGQLTSGSDTLMLDGGNLTSTGGTIAGTVQFGPTQAWVLTDSPGR